MGGSMGTWDKWRQTALLGLVGFLAACSALPTPPPPTIAPERRQAQIAEATQVAIAIAATIEARNATQTALGHPPTVTPTPLPPTPSPTPPATPALVATRNVTYTTNGPKQRQELALQNPPAGALQIRGAIQINQITTSGAVPTNQVTLVGSACDDCQVLVIALQINLTLGSIATAGGQNLISLSYSAENCDRCQLVARALQLQRTIATSREMPPDLVDFAVQFQQTIEALNAQPTLTAFAAEEQIDALLAQYPTLQASLSNQRAAYPR